jgi:hypothetical protein
METTYIKYVLGLYLERGGDVLMVECVDGVKAMTREPCG